MHAQPAQCTTELLQSSSSDVACGPRAPAAARGCPVEARIGGALRENRAQPDATLPAFVDIIATISEMEKLLDPMLRLKRVPEQLLDVLRGRRQKLFHTLSVAQTDEAAEEAASRWIHEYRIQLSTSPGSDT